MNIRRILLSLAILVFAGSVVAGGTGAFFSDEERSDGNLFTAGSIDLKVDSEAHYNGMICEDVDPAEEIEVYEWHADGVIFAQDNDVPVNNYPQPGDTCDGTWELTDIGPGYTFFSYEDLKPGDHGENTISLHVFENDAWACAVIDNMVDYENGCTEPEGEPEGTDTTCSGDIETPMSGAGDGELSSELHFFAWADDGDNEWAGPTEEPVLFGNVEGPASDIFGGVAYELFAPGLNDDAVLSADSVEYIGLYWCYGEISTAGDELSCDGTDVDNTTQTDGLTADIMFYVEQARNNPGFVCPEPDRPEPTNPDDKAGANLLSFVAPGTCDYTINDTQSIQATVDGASTGETICLEDGTYNTYDTYPITVDVTDLMIAGLNQGSSAFIPGGFFITADGVTVTGLTFTDYSFIGSSENAAIYLSNTITGGVISFNKFMAPGDAKANSANAIINQTASGATPQTTGVIIRHNVFESWHRGLFLNPSSGIVIRNNDIYNNNVGSANDGPNSNTILLNDFQNNGEAIGMSDADGGTGNDNVLNANQNNITDGQVNAYLTGTLDATNNWWGIGTGSQAQQAGGGTVNTAPTAVAPFPEN